MLECSEKKTISTLEIFVLYLQLTCKGIEEKAKGTEAAKLRGTKPRSSIFFIYVLYIHPYISTISIYITSWENPISIDPLSKIENLKYPQCERATT